MGGEALISFEASLDRWRWLYSSPHSYPSTRRCSNVAPRGSKSRQRHLSPGCVNNFFYWGLSGLECCLIIQSRHSRNSCASPVVPWVVFNCTLESQGKVERTASAHTRTHTPSSDDLFIRRRRYELMIEQEGSCVHTHTHGTFLVRASAVKSFHIEI